MPTNNLNPHLVLMAAEEGAKQLGEAQQTIAGLKAENDALVQALDAVREKLLGTRKLNVWQVRGEIDQAVRYLKTFEVAGDA